MNNALSKKVIIACFLAGCLEIYDFVLFAFLSPIFSKHYLSFLDSETATILNYGLFAVGFLFRPLGSIIFGYIGDTLGRKKALLTSVSLMAISSISLCLLPTYSVIGITSCYLLVIIRIIQGISVGGEYSGAIIFAIEHSNGKKAGLVGGIVVSGCLIGVMLAKLMATILQNPELPSNSWRLAFLLGFCLSMVGFFIRNNLLESPEFIELALSKRNKIKIPLLEGLKIYMVEVIAMILLVGTNGMCMYFITVFLLDYIKNINHVDLGYLVLMPTLVPAILAPIVGFFSDKYGRGKLLVLGIASIGIYSIFTLPILLKSTDIVLIACLIFGYAALFSVQSGTLNTFSVEIFKTEYRYSCGSFSYATGMALIGGLTPMISALLTQNNRGIEYLRFYFAIAALLGFIAGIVIIRRKDNIIFTSKKEVIGAWKKMSKRIEN